MMSLRHGSLMQINACPTAKDDLEANDLRLSSIIIYAAIIIAFELSGAVIALCAPQDGAQHRLVTGSSRQA